MFAKSEINVGQSKAVYRLDSHLILCVVSFLIFFLHFDLYIDITPP